MATRQACRSEPFLAGWQELKAALLIICFHGGLGQGVGDGRSPPPLLQEGGSVWGGSGLHAASTAESRSLGRKQP